MFCLMLLNCSSNGINSVKNKDSNLHTENSGYIKKTKGLDDFFYNALVFLK